MSTSIRCVMMRGGAGKGVDLRGAGRVMEPAARRIMEGTIHGL